MEQKPNLKELNRELERFELESKKYEKQNEAYKNSISTELKKINKEILFNSKQTEIETEFTLWERLKKVLRMN
jgi:hypothetical protein